MAPRSILFAQSIKDMSTAVRSELLNGSLCPGLTGFVGSSRKPALQIRSCVWQSPLVAKLHRTCGNLPSASFSINDPCSLNFGREFSLVGIPVADLVDRGTVEAELGGDFATMFQSTISLTLAENSKPCWVQVADALLPHSEPLS